MPQNVRGGLLPQLWRFYHPEKELIDAPILRFEGAGPDNFPVINSQYQARMAAARQALRNRDWHEYIFSHERPYRLEALRRCLSCNSRDNEEACSQAVRDVWIDSENIRQHRRLWRRIWEGANLTAPERTALDTMPDIVPIFRGVSRARDSNGLSWTLDREQAKSFATRYAVNGFLCSGQVAKVGIRAILLDRGEREVIVFPDCIRNLEIVSVTRD
jgi:hypothetical protein